MSFIIRIGCLLLAFLITNLKAVSQNSLKLTTEKGSRIYFNIKKAKVENINGKINISLLSKKSKVFEINGIPETIFTDTTVKILGTSVVYISDTVTFKSISERGNLFEISCQSNKPNTSFTLVTNGKMYNGKKTIVYSFTYKGTLPAKQQLKSTH